MKTLEQVKAECIGDVYTLNDFADLIDAGCINQYDGDGFSTMAKNKQTFRYLIY